MMSKAMGRFMGDDSLKFKQCSLLNVSVCEGSSSEKGFMVVMWNPSSSERRGMFIIYIYIYYYMCVCEREVVGGGIYGGDVESFFS